MTPEEDLPDEVIPRAYYSRPVWQRNITIFAGPFANFVAAIVILFGFYLVVGLPTASLTIDTVQENTPAAAAGLVVGDTLVAGDGKAFTDWESAATFLQAHPNQPVELTYRTAGGDERTLKVTLETFEDDATKGLLGVSPASVNDAQPPLAAARLAAVGTYDIFRLTFKGLGMLLSGDVDFGGDQGAVGPVGIVAVSSDAARQGYYPLLLAFISINLGIMNLLPFLPFDGGHIMLNFAERVRGRRLSAKLVERLTAIGVTLLVAFFLYVTWNDIARLLG